jgi:hypothetical protein
VRVCARARVCVRVCKGEGENKPEVAHAGKQQSRHKSVNVTAADADVDAAGRRCMVAGGGE